MQHADKMVVALRNMDSIIRMASDLLCGPFMDWILLLLPDGATDQDIRDYVTAPDGQLFYLLCCLFFARRVADMLVHGQWSYDGYSMLLFNSLKYTRLSTFDNVRVNVKALAKYIADREVTLLLKTLQRSLQDQEIRSIHLEVLKELRATYNNIGHS